MKMPISCVRRRNSTKGRNKERRTNRKSKMASPFMDKETYDSLPLTGWLDKSGKPIQDHPDLPEERSERTILKKNGGNANGSNVQVKIVRETLKAKCYDLKQVETGSVNVGDDLRRLLERLADDRPVAQTNDKDEPEVSILGNR